MNTTAIAFPSNRLSDVEKTFVETLSPTYGADEVGTFVMMLCEAFLGWDRVAYLLHRGETINQSDLLRFHWALEDLKHNRPIQHIVGYTDFCGCRIEVNEKVLIPRPETEEMVMFLGSKFKVQGLSVLDLCTGSGCIAIALKKLLPQSVVVGVDISVEALEVAKRNALENGTEVGFIQDDVLSGSWQTTTNDRWDLIVSNPPYISESEKTLMQANVLDYEPSLALFVPDNDPLLFYRNIAFFAKQHLSVSGLLAMEINENFGRETLHLLRDYGLVGELHKDFRDKDRFVTAVLSSR